MNNPRWMFLFASSALLVFLAGLLNHTVSAWNLFFFPYGLLLPLPALNCKSGQALLALVLSGLLLDASLPLPFGLFALALPLLYLAFLLLGSRLVRDRPLHLLLLAHLANLLLFLLASVVAWPPHASFPSLLPRLLTDLLASHLLLLLLGPWFLQLQLALLSLAGVDLLTEDLEPA